MTAEERIAQLEAENPALRACSMAILVVMAGVLF